MPTSSNSAIFVTSWPYIAAVTYAGALITGIILSFTTRQQPRRRNIRIATAALTIPIWLSLALITFLRFTLFKEPPTLVELQHDFPSKRVDLEMILLMADEDINYSRIAPDFLDRASETPHEWGRYMSDDPKAGLSKSRWDAYRKIYLRDGIRLGIQRDSARDAFIMVDSVGLLNRGHITGYLHCVQNAPLDIDRFYPCALHQDHGERKFDPQSGEEAYSFQKLDDRWYAYDEGPS